MGSIISNEHTFSIAPTSPNEMFKKLTLLDGSKSMGPNCLPTRIPKLVKNDISTQVAKLFNVLFSTPLASHHS